MTTPNLTTTAAKTKTTAKTATTTILMEKKTTETIKIPTAKKVTKQNITRKNKHNEV